MSWDDELDDLAVLVCAERPRPREAFTHELDLRVERRFAPAVRAPRRMARWWPAAPALAALAAAAVVLSVGFPGPSTSHTRDLVRGPLPQASSGEASSSAGTTSAGAPASSSAIVPAVPSVVPAPANRKVVAAAGLALLTPATRIEDVASEVLNVVSRENAVVERSNVTAAGQGSYAEFQLSVPSGALTDTMGQLSRLPFAAVSSRTDSSSDVTDQYGAAQRRLADARALRSSLLRQLQNASSTAQIESLKAQIADVERAIGAAGAALRALQHQVGFSRVDVSIAAAPPHHVIPPAGHGFTLGGAARDAGRVLEVAAGIALIALAALLPAALLVAVALWIAALLRRRARERALDAV